MITTALIVVASLLCLGLMYYAVQGRIGLFESAKQVERQFTPLDVVAFQNLIDSEDQRFLRDMLSPRRYRRVQRERIGVCLAYVRCCARNAAILIRIGESAAQSSNAEIRATGQRMLSDAIRMRMYAVALVPKVTFWWIFPNLELSIAMLGRKYNQMAAALADLNMLKQGPASSPQLATL